MPLDFASSPYCLTPINLLPSHFKALVRPGRDSSRDGKSWHVVLGDRQVLLPLQALS
jgi:hypothetical protein